MVGFLGGPFWLPLTLGSGGSLLDFFNRVGGRLAGETFRNGLHDFLKPPFVFVGAELGAPVFLEGCWETLWCIFVRQ